MERHTVSLGPAILSQLVLALLFAFAYASEWVQVFVDEKLTTALLDRLGHHAHVLTTKGSSFRREKARLVVTTVAGSSYEMAIFSSLPRASATFFRVDTRTSSAWFSILEMAALCCTKPSCQFVLGHTAFLPGIAEKVSNLELLISGVKPLRKALVGLLPFWRDIYSDRHARRCLRMWSALSCSAFLISSAGVFGVFFMKPWVSTRLLLP